MNRPSHLSFAVLDGLRLGGAPTPEEHQHLAGCSLCAAYLEPPLTREIPAWLSQLPPAGPPLGPAPPGVPGRPNAGAPPAPGDHTGGPAGLVPPPAPPGRPGRWLRLGLPAPAVLTAALLIWAGRPASPPREPAVQLRVLRGGEERLWDGKTPVRPGDGLRLELRAPGYRYLSVAWQSAAGLRVLYAGPAAEPERRQPLLFRVNEQPPREVMSIVLAPRPIHESWHRPTGAGDGTWRTSLVLVKQPGSASPPQAAREEGLR